MTSNVGVVLQKHLWDVLHTDFDRLGQSTSEMLIFVRDSGDLAEGWYCCNTAERSNVMKTVLGEDQESMEW